MKRKKFTLFFLFFLLIPFGTGKGEAQSQGIVKVGLFPFRIYAPDPEKIKKWQDEIWQVLTKELAKEEQIVIPEEEKVREAWEEAFLTKDDEELAREIGQKIDLDYIIMGSLTKINGTISLDARIMDVLQGKVAASAFSEGRETEKVEEIAKKLSQELSLKILKKEVIGKVLVEGNRAIEESAIRARIKIKEGDIFSSRLVREDLKAIYQLGYFQDVRVEKRPWGRKQAVVFIVEEKPVIKEIKFSGHKALKTSELQEVLDLKPRSVLNLNAVQENLQKILKKYQEEAYLAAEVKYELETPKKGEVIVHYRINEGKKIKIKSIKFSGNKHFSDERLKKLLPETKEEGFFSWFTKSGIYKEETLERDLDAILAFYLQKGFYQAKVGKPQVNFIKDHLEIVIPIEEGPQFKVGRVDITGDLIAPKEELFKFIKTYEGEILNIDKIRESVSQLTDQYADKGYAFVEVSPQTTLHPDQKYADLSFHIQKGNKVYFERINIQGNTKTRDKVIRRELKVVEGELYSLRALNRSRENLQRLGFFKEINLTPKKGSAEDKMDLTVQVEEQPTGAFSVGAGYSSIDKLMTMIQISQNNLFGRGQRLILSAQLGSISQYYNLSFTDPWLFDTRISGGGDLYRTRREYDDYTVQRTGGGVRFGFPLFEEVRGYLSYKYEQVEISDVLETASYLIQEQKGTSTTSSIAAALRRDTRDHYFDPTKGSDHTISAEYAGGPLGGTNYFTRYGLNTVWFYTPFGKLTFMARGRIGLIQGNEGHPIPLFERYRLGGINTVRGFKAFSIGPKAPNGEVIGGDKELLFNLEMTFPLIPTIKLKGVIFFDAGNAFDVGEPYRLEKLRTSAGVGIRWISPVGPLRLEWGYNISPQEGEQRQGWDFSIGTLF